jgi:hypothetical protein
MKRKIKSLEQKFWEVEKKITKLLVETHPPCSKGGKHAWHHYCMKCGLGR